MALEALMKKKPFKLLDEVQSRTQGKILVLDGQSQNMVLSIDGGILPATGTLTFTGNAVAGETITIDRQIYTWVAALSSDPVTEDANEIVVQATQQLSLQGFVAAVNGTGQRGIQYGEGTLPNIAVTADDDGGGDVDLFAKRRGVHGNSVVTTETMTAASFGAGTLLGGTDGVYTLEFRATQNGETWYLIRGQGLDDDVRVNNIVSDVGLWRFDVSAVLAFKVDVFAYTSGLINAEAFTDRMAFS